MLWFDHHCTDLASLLDRRVGGGSLIEWKARGHREDAFAAGNPACNVGLRAPPRLVWTGRQHHSIESNVSLHEITNRQFRRSVALRGANGNAAIVAHHSKGRGSVAAEIDLYHVINADVYRVPEEFCRLTFDLNQARPLAACEV